MCLEKTFYSTNTASFRTWGCTIYVFSYCYIYSQVHYAVHERCAWRRPSTALIPRRFVHRYCTCGGRKGPYYQYMQYMKGPYMKGPRQYFHILISYTEERSAYYQYMRVCIYLNMCIYTHTHTHILIIRTFPYYPRIRSAYYQYMRVVRTYLGIYIHAYTDILIIRGRKGPRIISICVYVYT
jgi:hypothetical protein